MHPVVVDPAALPSGVLPLLDLATAADGCLLAEAVGGVLGEAVDAFDRAWSGEGADIGQAARQQAAALVHAAELYEQLEATLVLGRLR